MKLGEIRIALPAIKFYLPKNLGLIPFLGETAIVILNVSCGKYDAVCNFEKIHIIPTFGARNPCGVLTGKFGFFMSLHACFHGCSLHYLVTSLRGTFNNIIQIYGRRPKLSIMMDIQKYLAGLPKKKNHSKHKVNLGIIDSEVENI